MLTPTYLFLSYLVIVLFFVAVYLFVPRMPGQAEVVDTTDWPITFGFVDMSDNSKIRVSRNKDGSGEVERNGRVIVSFGPGTFK